MIHRLRNGFRTEACIYIYPDRNSHSPACLGGDVAAVEPTRTETRYAAQRFASGFARIMIHVVQNQIKCILLNERPRDISLV